MSGSSIAPVTGDERAIGPDQRGEGQFATPALVGFEIQPFDEIVGEAILNEAGEPRLVDAALRARRSLSGSAFTKTMSRDFLSARDFRPVRQLREAGRTSHRPEMHHERTPGVLLAQLLEGAAAIGLEFGRREPPRSTTPEARRWRRRNVKPFRTFADHFPFNAAAACARGAAAACSRGKGKRR